MVLKTVAMVVGIIGGIYGLMAMLIGGGIAASLFSSTSLIYSGLALLLALAPPIIGVVGAGIVRNKPLIGSGLMAASGIVMIALGIIILPFGIALIPPASLFIVGAILGALGKYQS